LLNLGPGSAMQVLHRLELRNQCVEPHTTA
jgi:hypothetical protein